MDIFILLIISTVILTLVLIYEILYRIFNRGRGIYPLSFTLNQTTDKNGSAEGGSNSGTILPTSSAQSSAEQQQQQSQPYDVTECPSTEDPKLESKFFEPNWKNIGIEYGELRENDTKICLPLPGRIHDERLKLLRAHYATQVVPGILETGHIDGGIYYRDGKNPKYIYDGDEYDSKEEAQLAVHYDRQFVIKEWYEQTHKNDMAYFVSVNLLKYNQG
uniref:Uncharacterized protein n=1 Tax=Panagrolaimus superbus TaxID=310955 RepID=A0A914YI27_9BILA